MLIIDAYTAIKFVVAVAIGYKVLSGLSWYDFAKSLVARLPKPHTMTPAEQEAWFDRAKGTF